MEGLAPLAVRFENRHAIGATPIHRRPKGERGRTLLDSTRPASSTAAVLVVGVTNGR